MVLFPSKCELTQVLKGTWELQLEHPIDPDGRWKSIEENGVISAVTPQGTQLFRIDNRKKSDEAVTAVAYPIFFDSADEIFMLDVRPTIKTGKEALNLMLNGSTKYSVESDIAATSTAYYVRKNFMEALNGDDDNAFLNRWGGEPIYDNYKVIVNEKAGGNYGVRVLYGKNLEGAEEEIDYSEIVTRIVPTSFNGYMLDGDEPWVDSPLINSYPKIYYKTVHFEDVKLTVDSDDGDEETFDTLEELRVELVRRCNLEFENGADKPTVTLDIDLVDIAKTEEYKDYEILETIGLGDTLYCRHRGLGIETEARAVEIVWDCIEEKIVSVVIGDYKEPALNSVFNAEHKVSQTITDEGSLRAERVSGIIDMMETQLRCQQSIAQRQDVRAILFEDTDDTSDTYGAMCLGTQGFQIANKRTADGRDWDWSTFGTANGFVADLIIAGILYSSNYVQGSQGIKIDLDKGEILSKNFNVDADGNVSMTGALKSSSAEITGGYFKVATSSETYSTIELTSGGWSALLAPLQLVLSNSNTGNSVNAQAGGFFFRKADGTIGSIISSGAVYFYNASGNIVTNMSADRIAYGETTYTGAQLSIMGSGSIRDNFNVYGTFYAASGSIASSDRHLKNSIEDLDAEFCLNFIMSLEPSRYKYNDGTSGRYHHGFIADEVLKAMNGEDWGLYCEVKRPAVTESVINDETGEEEVIVVEEETTSAGLRYEELIAPIVKVVQYQQEKIEKLEATLDKVMAFINYKEAE